jgi:hypothetical protein
LHRFPPIDSNVPTIASWQEQRVLSAKERYSTELEKLPNISEKSRNLPFQCVISKWEKICGIDEDDFGTKEIQSSLKKKEEEMDFKMKPVEPMQQFVFRPQHRIKSSIVLRWFERIEKEVSSPTDTEAEEAKDLPTFDPQQEYDLETLIAISTNEEREDLEQDLLEDEEVDEYLYETFS